MGLLLMERGNGISLNHRWLAGQGEPEDGDKIADLLGWMAQHPIPTGFPTHGIDDETRVLEERLPVFKRILKEPPASTGDLMQRVLTELRADPPTDPVLCHRDFHDKQVLLEEGAGMLIDLDLAAAGPPALDVGNILAHLRLRALKGAPLPWRAIAGRLVEARRGLVANSLHRWTAAALMRLALIYARRKRGPTLIDDLLISTTQALERSGEWEGILE